MARPGPSTHAKRQRELAKQEKRRAKAERRELRKAEKAQAREQRSLTPGVDPDLAGIQPGPQPLRAPL
ncbi:MAG TPA: hypothetical protein VD793_09315 [Gemmatimonadales bacterium]|nr:hypothetical protein [Gemmatimonadales bacterium]